MRTPDLRAFLRLLQRPRRRPLIFVRDRWSVHRAAVARLLAKRPPWLVALARLPAYAPELKPVEPVGNPTKYTELANYLPDHWEALHEAVGFALASQRFQQTRLRSCFGYAKLKL